MGESIPTAAPETYNATGGNFCFPFSSRPGIPANESERESVFEDEDVGEDEDDEDGEDGVGSIVFSEGSLLPVGIQLLGMSDVNAMIA